MDRDRLTALLEAERALHHERNPGSRAQFAGAGHLFTGVPMTWMADWAGRLPAGLAGAHGARVTDVDGHHYVDFALGDTGAMAGHSPAPVIEAVRAGSRPSAASPPCCPARTPNGWPPS